MEPTDNTQCTAYCQTCQLDDQCGSGGYCLADRTGGGHCTTPCTHSSDCPSGAACYDLDVDDGPVITGCFPISYGCGQGGSRDYCRACTQDAECATGFCARDGNGNGRCTGVPDVDQACPYPGASAQADLVDVDGAMGPDACFPSSGLCLAVVH